MDRLKNYDKDRIKHKMLRKLRNKIKKIPSYRPDVIEVTNKASASLCKWTLAMERYARIQLELAPIREKLRNLNIRMTQSKKSLKDERNAL